MNPNADLEELKKVAAGELLELEFGKLVEWRAKGWRATKASVAENVKVQTITVSNGETSATATYCGNSTGVDVIDRHGKSHVVIPRTFYPTIVTLTKGKDGRWLPVRERDGGDACAGR